jgi:hypothetical protein
VGAAEATIANPFWSGNLELLAQRVEQRDARFEVCSQLFAIDVEGDRHLPWSEDVNFFSGNFENGGAKNQRSRRGEGGYLKEFTSRNSRALNIVLITHLLLSFVSVSEVTGNGSASENSLQRAFYSTND